jgi:hypothetical protein
MFVLILFLAGLHELIRSLTLDFYIPEFLFILLTKEFLIL